MNNFFSIYLFIHFRSNYTVKMSLWSGLQLLQQILAFLMTSITRLKEMIPSLRLDITAAYSKGNRLQQPKSSTKCTQTTPHADHRVMLP